MNGRRGKVICKALFKRLGKSKRSGFIVSTLILKSLLKKIDISYLTKVSLVNKKKSKIKF